NSGLKKDAVNHRLESEGYPVTITLDENETSLVNVNDELQELKQLVKYQATNQEKMISELFNMKNEYMELKKELNKKDATIDRFISESMEARKGLASALEEEKKKKPFFKKLFRR